MRVEKRCAAARLKARSMQLQRLLQLKRAWRKKLLDAEPARNDLLLDGEVDDRLERLAIGLDAEREGIATHHLGQPACLVVGWRARGALAKLLHINRLGLLERGEEVGRERWIGGQ